DGSGPARQSNIFFEGQQTAFADQYLKSGIVRAEPFDESRDLSGRLRTFLRYHVENGRHAADRLLLRWGQCCLGRRQNLDTGAAMTGQEDAAALLVVRRSRRLGAC